MTTEALIGFKLQALANNPSRGRDLDDIRALLRAQRGRLNMQELREYFTLFNRLGCLMSYSTKFSTDLPDGSGDPLVGQAVRLEPKAGKSDLSDWVELMEVVEALCPVWPVREEVEGGIYKL